MLQLINAYDSSFVTTDFFFDKLLSTMHCQQLCIILFWLTPEKVWNVHNPKNSTVHVTESTWYPPSLLKVLFYCNTKFYTSYNYNLENNACYQ